MQKTKLGSWRCQTALRGWYDVHHRWWHIFLFTKNTWIRDSGASCHITNNDTGLYDVTNVDESIQGSSCIIPVIKKRKLQVKVCQVDGTEQVHTLWPMKFCPKAGVNLFSLTCEILQENKIASDQQNYIMVNTPTSGITLDCQIRPVTVGLQESIFFVKPTIKGQYLLPPYPREISRPSCWIRSFF